MLLAAATASVAAGDTPPAAVRPGALRPGEERPTSPPEPAGAVFSVPPRLDRDIVPSEGPKVVVSRFELVGIADHPDLGISLEQLQALVESKRSAHPEGFTVGYLEEVSAEVTKYLRSQGLILAQAFIPVQDVKDGVVKIEVLEGRLGRVLAEGNEDYRTGLLQKPFEGAIGQPVTKEQMESKLLTVTDYPGMNVFGVFQPGQQVGDADLVLKVQDERKFNFRARADNHGVRETGQRRYRLEADVNNVTYAADILRLTAQANSNPRDTFFWRAEYERPLWFDPTYRVNVNFDRNRFDVLGQFRDQRLFSDTMNGHIWVEKSILRGRSENLYAKIDLARKRAQTNARGVPVSRDNLTSLAFEANYDGVDARFAGLNFVQVQITHGFNDFLGAMGDQDAVSAAATPPSRVAGSGGSREFSTGEFNKAFMSYQRLQALSILHEKLKNQSLLFRFEGQWTSDVLVPLEQFAIGGPASVRAYQPTDALFDRGYFASLEWIINAPLIADKPSPFGNRAWGELLRAHLFYDRAYGSLVKRLPNEDFSNLYQGAGAAVSFDVPNKFNATITIAYPLTEPTPQNGKSPQGWVDFTWFF
ncbi:MAG: ShlB/FhaC/HecB family hemolysin secretion/activation protein [Gammaproteobacteria bacterium]